MKKCLVIGGSGFLGKHIVEDLIQAGYETSAFDIRKDAAFSDNNNTLSKVQHFFVGDLCDEKQVANAIKTANVDTVFHTATPTPFSPSAILKKVNVDGTKVLLDKCAELGVKNFVLTATASCIYHGQDIVDADETYPYAPKGVNEYTDTKIEQEKMVLAYNGVGGLKTVSIRPSALFGPGDELFFPAVIAAAKKGRTKAIMGNGKNAYDFTYIKNVSHGHILAAQKINNEGVAGQTFFITNDERYLFWDFLGRVSAAFGTKPSFHVPYFVLWPAFFLLYLVQLLVNLILPIFGVKKRFELPADIQFEKLSYFTNNRTFNCSKAKKALGFKPKYTVEEGLAITLKYFKEKDQKESAKKSN